MLELLVRSGPAGEIDLRPVDVHRLECYALITLIKDRGLGEAVQSLRDMVEFYSEEPAPALAAPPARPMRAAVVGSYTSTVPPLAEE